MNGSRSMSGYKPKFLRNCDAIGVSCSAIMMCWRLKVGRILSKILFLPSQSLIFDRIR